MGGEWSKSSAYPEEWTTRDRERRLRLIAGRQRHLVTSAQLSDLGFGKSVVHDRVAAGRWFATPFAAVYSLAPPPLSRLQTIRAGALSCSHPSLPSHWSATEVLEIAEPPLFPVHVTRPGGNGRRRPKLVVHRSFVPACDTTGRDGILCTSAARTIADLAAITEPEELERILIAADSLRIVNHRRLEELAVERRGARALRSLLFGDPITVRSGRETELLQAFRRAGLPEPAVNGFVEGYEVDYHWPELRLVVELDGWRFHGGRARMNTDRERDQILALAGWRSIRFTRDQVAADADECARRTATVALRRVGEPADQGRRRRSGLRP